MPRGRADKVSQPDVDLDLGLAAVDVSYKGRPVGKLAATSEGPLAFEYDNEWLAKGFSISPLSLPLTPGVSVAKPEPLSGVFGVFDDSLPDGWGRLLVDRMLRANGIEPRNVSSLVRLAIVGASGMGALEYAPRFSLPHEELPLDFDALAAECTKVLQSEPTTDAELDTLFALGGSSGGARPKALVFLDGASWIVKFPSSYDPINIGEQEFSYAKAARTCGLILPETRLFPSKICGGYFGVRRFDRPLQADGGETKTHMVSAGGLLETSHRIPNLDYDILMRLTLMLTHSSCDTEALFRLMCFNVFAGNRDDHAKNFSYLYDEDDGSWHLSPAYDLTESAGTYGERATTVNGKGKDIDLDNLVAVGKTGGLGARQSQAIVQEIREIVRDELGVEND